MSKKKDNSKKVNGKKHAKKEVKKHEKNTPKTAQSKPMKPQFVWPKEHEVKDNKPCNVSEEKKEETLMPEEAGFASFEEPKLNGDETPFIFTSHVSVGTSANFDEIKSKTSEIVEKTKKDIKGMWKTFIRRMKGLA
jgi:hypothetical protein